MDATVSVLGMVDTMIVMIDIVGVIDASGAIDRNQHRGVMASGRDDALVHHGRGHQLRGGKHRGHDARA